MASQSVDHPGHSHLHRPMSLLLQALKQIEVKTPLLATGHDLGIDETTASTAVVRGGIDGAVSFPCHSIDLIRNYEPFETATEVALAGPVPVALVPQIEPSTQSAAPTIHKDWRRRQFADNVLKYLPNNGRAVIALAAAETLDAWPSIRELCLGLAERKTGDVLAIADAAVDDDHQPNRPSLSDLLSTTAGFDELARTDAEQAFHAISRGNDEVLAGAGVRSMLKLWQRLNDRFSYIVVDAGPLDATAARSILASCDGAFAIVRLHRTYPRDAERLVARIRAAGGRTCGCLVVG